MLTISLAGQGLKIRQFIGISGDNLVLTGSYDGKSFFDTETGIILVPKIDPGFGAGITYGFSFGKAVLDFSYHLTRVNYTSLEPGFSGSASIHTVRYLGAKIYLGHDLDRKLKPFIDIDLSVSYTKFGNISYTEGNSTDMKPATYGGIITGLGAGAEYMPGKKLAAVLTVLPEFYIGTDIKAEGSKRYEVKKFSNFMLLNSIGLRYYFTGK